MKNKEKKMKAFHGDEAIKEKYLSRVRAHREADQLVKGVYWQDGKGCAVGCTVHSGDHLAYERELGVPELVARLEDGLFERLPNDLAMLWPEEFLSAIPVGADLASVGPRFMVWMLDDPEEGIIRGVENESVKKVVLEAADFYEQLANSGVVSEAERSSDARAALAALDARAALDALDARAALASDDLAKYESARSSMYVRMSKKLLELLSNAPAPTVV